MADTSANSNSALAEVTGWRCDRSGRSGNPWQDADGTVMVIGRFLELVPDEQVVHLVASDDSIFADETKTNGK